MCDRHGRALYSLARAIVGEPADAEEVVADVFIQIWRNPGAFDPSRGSVMAYLSVATRSRALDRIRSGKRRTAAVRRAAEGDETGVAAPVSAFGANPDGVAEERELREAVRAGVSSLPDPQRIALELAYFRGLTHREIASQLAQPLGTVKTRIRDGMRKLRDALAPFHTGGGS